MESEVTTSFILKVEKCPLSSVWGCEFKGISSEKLPLETSPQPRETQEGGSLDQNQSPILISREMKKSEKQF